MLRIKMLQLCLKRKPLKAISLRTPKILSPSPTISSSKAPSEEWPDESSFRIERWERPENDFQQNIDSLQVTNRQPFSNRPLPKSSRKRN